MQRIPLLVNVISAGTASCLYFYSSPNDGHRVVSIEFPRDTLLDRFDAPHLYIFAADKTGGMARHMCLQDQHVDHSE